jgi:hypothetical protein
MKNARLPAYNRYFRWITTPYVKFITTIEEEVIINKQPFIAFRGIVQQLSSSPFSPNETKKRMIQALIEKSKYLDDENFLKPVKKKRKKTKQRKSKSKKIRRISESEYNRLLALTKDRPISRARAFRREQGEDTPEWAKLARVSTIPNR